MRVRLRLDLDLFEKQVLLRLPLLWIALAFCAMACGTTPAATDTTLDAAAGDAADVAVADIAHKDVAAVSDTTPDTADAHADGATPDAIPGTDVNVNCPGGARCPCATNAECDKGVCVETADGKICAAPCAGDSGCLASESCSLLDAGGGDSQTLCTPRWVSFCAPCLQNSDCSFSGSGGVTICAPLGASGSFCTATCKVAGDCPSGTTCSGGICHPAGDTCACSNWAVTHQNGTSCSVKNAAGQCAAPLKCAATGPWPVCLAATPTAETCNGKDDNCNGLTDDATGATCDDGDPCTQDACNGGVCQHLKNVVCGDGTCADQCGESTALCPIDCHVCGNKLCEPGESPATCAGDCCGGCGDGKCVGYQCGENPTTCPQDCGTACGNKVCDKGENPGSCPMDCPPATCGNHVCEPTEGPKVCPQDCAATCGNCVCEKSEDFTICPNDCGYCGDGTCSICGALGEDPKTCLADCGDIAEVGCTSKAWTAFCQDDSPCTDDICQPGKGCVHLASAGTCADGNACTTGDACSNGTCVPSGVQTCDDGNPCTNDYCDLAVGCTAFALDKIGCDDNDWCTVGDACLNSACVPGGPRNCTDGNACTDDSCGGGKCVNAANTATCDDGNACTLADACSVTTCHGTPTVCDDGTTCTTDSCDGVTGACINTPLQNGTTCDDGDPCSLTDICGGGACTGTAIVCKASDQCHDVGSCSGGTCSDPAKSDATGCEDGNGCTKGDACTGGNCAAGVVNCDDGNACTADSCDASQTCEHANLADWTVCGDGLVCNGTGACQDVKVGKGMAYIPTGTFWMGCNATKDAKCSAQSSENPQHKVTLSAYYMDLTETTVGQYKGCVDAGACTVPQEVQPDSSYATYPGPTINLVNYVYWTNPVNYLDWTQSNAYCKWRGSAFDLPTEAQWEMAARGSCEKNGSTAGDPGCAASMRTYPWGEAAATCSYAVKTDGNYGCGTGLTWAAGLLPAGDSPYGLHDMAGNVWEWTRDAYSATYYSSSPATDPLNSASASNPVIRGGGFMDSGVATLRTGSRFGGGGSSGTAFSFLGLRCMRSYP